MINYIENYSKNNKLEKLVDNIIFHNFGWLPQKDYDDFYSIAWEVLWRCSQQFQDDKGTQFETYLINCLLRKFKTRVTYMNRQRRNNGINDYSLDALIADRDTCLIELIVSHEETKDELSEKMLKYLGRLSKLQKQVLFGMSEGYSPEEIRQRLKISTKELSDACAAIRSYRNVSILY